MNEAPGGASASPLIRAATPAAIAEAAAVLQDGGLVAFPTETVYGVGADATRNEAVARLFRAKGRPSNNPLIVHVADRDAAAAVTDLGPTADALARRFWPGPLTLVVPRGTACPVSGLVTTGLDTVALRVPDHPVALALLGAAGLPVAAPSANRSGRLSPTAAAHVTNGLGPLVDFILDGGECRIGIESTVVAVADSTVRILRQGGVPHEVLVDALGDTLVDAEHTGAPLAPGMLPTHYAPRARLRLNANSVSAEEGLVAFGGDAPAGAKCMRNLSPAGDLGEAANRFYAALRELDDEGVGIIAVVPIPEVGMGRAINDRLRRAAAPRGEAR